MGEPARPGRPPGSAPAGVVLAAATIIGASLLSRADRPAAVGDGIWTTPLLILVGVAGLGLLVAAFLLVRSTSASELTGSAPRQRAPRWRAIVVGLAVALLIGWFVDVTPRDEALVTEVADGASGAVDDDVGFDAPTPASPAAIGGGLLALALAGALAWVLVGRRPSVHHGDERMAALDDFRPSDLPPDLPDGPPDAVVLAAWAVARHRVVAALRDGDHDPPERLLRRVRGTDLEAPLAAITERYVPVRYGRGHATEADAAAVRAALDQLLAGGRVAPADSLDHGRPADDAPDLGAPR